MKRPVSSWLWLTTALIGVVHASSLLWNPGWARADEPSSQAAQKEAKSHFQTGLTLYKEGAYDAALVEFRESYRLGGRASALRNVAQCQRDLKDFAAAHASFERLLATHDKELGKDERQTITRALAELAALTGFIELTGAAEGAAVEVDAKPVGTTPLTKPIRANVGVRRVRLTKAGLIPFETTTTVVAERAVSVAVDLRPEVVTGHVVIRAKGDVQLPLLVDGTVVGNTPWEGDLGPGQHTIQIKSESSSSSTETLQVVTGSRHEVTLEAVAEVGRVEIQVSPAQATIEIDGKLMGAGAWAGDLTPGKHELRVSAPGSIPQTTVIEVSPKRLLTQTIMLSPAPAGASALPPPVKAEWEGIYFGLGLHGDLVGKAVEHPECPSDTGATCKQMQPMGGGLLARLGYAFGFVGAEVVAGGRFQMYEDTREFQDLPDQRYAGSPYLPYAFYRREIFQGYDLGAYVGVGPRLNTKGIARFTLGTSIGANMRSFTLSRSLPDHGKTTFTARYVAPSWMFDAGVMIGSTPGAKVTIGFLGQVDFPPNDLTSGPDDRYFEEVLDGKTQLPYSAPPPEYTIVSGPQFFFGPIIGAQWGH